MGQSSSKSVPAHTRVNIVDAVKGIAIILMVLGHTEQGATHRQIWAGMPGVERLVNFGDAFIYSFHMPAFFFVSGLFLAGSVERRGRWQFVLEKARTLLYPYLLWALLSFITDPLTAKFRSAAAVPTFREHISGILTGNSSWFLITLFVTQLLVLLILPLPRWLQMVVALSAGLLIPDSGITVLYKPFEFLPFLVAGMWFSADRVRRIATLSRTIAWVGFGVLLMLQLAMIGAWGAVNRWDRVAVGLCGIAMLLLLSQGMRGTAGDGALRWYGEASLGIFILSPFFQGVGREFVVHVLHTKNPVIYLTVITLCATTFPAVLWFSQDRLHIGWLFKWPAPKRATPSLLAKRDQVAS